MGEATRKLRVQRKLLEETKIVKIDLTQPGFAMSDADRKQLSIDGAEPELSAARILISQAVSSAHTDGMDRKTGKLWAGWQEVLSSAKDADLEVTQGQMEWLRQLISSETLRLPVGMAQWREALCDYLDGISVSLNEKEIG